MQAQKYLEEHYAIRNIIISNEFEYRSKKGKEAFKAFHENNIYVRMQLYGVNLSLNKLMAIFIKVADAYKERFEPHYKKWLPGHRSSKTTEIYTHVTNRHLRRIKSPLDKIEL